MSKNVGDDHQCPAPDCKARVPLVRLACPAHWYQLPEELRTEINTAYRRRRSDPARHRAALTEALKFWRASA